MRHLQPFRLERFFAAWEFKVKYLLSASDCESLSLADVLALADQDGLQRWQSLRLGYTESAGLPALREAIASLHASLAPDDVLVLTPEEGILLAMHALLAPGDRVVAIAPAYQSLHEIARALGCEVSAWQLYVKDGRWQLDLAELERLITAVLPKLVIVNFPHNPTGYLPEAGFWQALLDLVRSRGIALFSDEMYRFLAPDPARELTPACDLYDRAITLGGMSKAFALPGLRIGWLVTRHRPWLERCAELKDYTTICSSAPSEVLALIGLRARRTILARNHTIVRNNLPIARAFFAARTTAFRWIEPDAGSTAFPEWLGSPSADDICRAGLDEHGVCLLPGSLFDARRHFRIGLGRRSLAEALAAWSSVAH